MLQRLLDTLRQSDIVLAGWEEIVLETGELEHNSTSINPALVEQGMTPYVWNSVWGWGREDMAYRLANMGYRIVMCNASNLYFDQAYNRDPQEIGLSWSGYVDTRSAFSFAPENMVATATEDIYGRPLDSAYLNAKVRLTENGRQNILGIQGQLWSETLTDPEKVDYMLLPKLFGLAERAWAPAPTWEKEDQPEVLASDWAGFARTVGNFHLPFLDQFFGGLHYRIPLPGIRIQGDSLYANIRYPGLILKYTLADGEEKIYEGPIEIDDRSIRLKAYNSLGRSSRTVEYRKKNANR